MTAERGPFEPHLTFVRHAESTSNAGGISMPHAEIPLSVKGRTQAERVATVLPPEPARILVSPMIRTQETAAPYCARVRMTAAVREDLAEFTMVDYRLVAGLNGAERRKFVQRFWDRPDPDRRIGDAAETFREFAARVERFRQDMTATPPNTVIFGHGFWLSMLLWKLSGVRDDSAPSMRDFRSHQFALHLENCARVELSRTEDGWRWRIVRWPSDAG